MWRTIKLAHVRTQTDLCPAASYRAPQGLVTCLSASSQAQASVITHCPDVATALVELSPHMIPDKAFLNDECHSLDT